MHALRRSMGLLRRACCGSMPRVTRSHSAHSVFHSSSDGSASAAYSAGSMLNGVLIFSIM
jgi:hypothetical protein